VQNASPLKNTHGEMEHLSSDVEQQNQEQQVQWRRDKVPIDQLINPY